MWEKKARQTTGSSGGGAACKKHEAAVWSSARRRPLSLGPRRTQKRPLGAAISRTAAAIERRPSPRLAPIYAYANEQWHSQWRCHVVCGG
jgi:hypothetical protein